MNEDEVVVEPTVHTVKKTGIFAMRVTDKHLALIRLRREGYNASEVAVLIAAHYMTVLVWQRQLQHFFGFVPPKAVHRDARVDFYFPCEVCGERVTLRHDIPVRIACPKHRVPRVWLDPETPAWRTDQERVRYWYHHGGKASRSASSTKWTKKRLATDPAYKAKYDAYHREWQAARKAKRLETKA